MQSWGWYETDEVKGGAMRGRQNEGMERGVDDRGGEEKLCVHFE